jgi:hypothetical protein
LKRSVPMPWTSCSTCSSSSAQVDHLLLQHGKTRGWQVPRLGRQMVSPLQCRSIVLLTLPCLSH